LLKVSKKNVKFQNPGGLATPSDAHAVGNFKPQKTNLVITIGVFMLSFFYWFM